MFSEKLYSVKKLVFLGLAESGKSTMINGVIRGISPQFGDKYDATINYQRLTKTLCDTEIQIFDLGGQTRFLDRFTGDLSEFVFSNVESGAFIFVIEPLKVAEISRAKFYFELSLEKLEYYSPKSQVYVFLNKSDLLPKSIMDKTSGMIKDYLLHEESHEIRFYETSVFSESIFVSIGDILGEITGIRESLTPILEEFIQNHLTIVDQVQILTKEGAILLIAKNNKNLLNLSTKKTKEIFDSSLRQLDSQNEIIAVNELEERVLALIKFMDNGLALFVLLSRGGLEQDFQFTTAVFDHVLSLANHIELFTK
ncbi:MAG: ADP-ribosylation factor-like protein [Candidatus Hodarchaeota archaeon]